MKTSEELRAELARLEDEAKTVRAEIDELQKAVAEKAARLRDLHGSYHRYGEIRLTKAKIADAERLEKDAEALKVVWVEQPMRNKCDWVVRRVTKKRIYIAEIGCRTETYYDKKGVRYDYSGRINLPATFGENWEEILA